MAESVRVEALPGMGALIRDYLALTKPSILLLVLVTGTPALLLADPHRLDPAVAAAALLGTALASASAGALNHYLDRDIDALMCRTMRRPLPSGRLEPTAALVFGLLLALLSATILIVWTTPLAALLAVGSIFHYTVVYTAWLKRTTAQNIVIGGAAGASAPLIAWAAIAGRVDLPAWIMFAIVFLWTPPHFWSLALFRKEDYAAAGVPMLPVVAGERATRLQILVYTLLLVPTTFALVLAGSAGPIYAVAAAFLGARFIRQAWRVWCSGESSDCVSLFRFSIAYLLLLFAALTVDAVGRIALG